MWQALVAGYLVFGTTNNLLRRVLAQTIGEHNRLISAFFYLFFLLPVGALLALLFPHDLNVGWLNVALLLCGSILWPVYYIVAFHANRKVDVGIFAIIANLSPIFTLALALPFLHERVGELQFAGIMLLVCSGVLAAASTMRGRERASMDGILWCLLAAFMLGTAIAYERFMLVRIDFGAYLVYGWGAQVIWAAILAGKDLRKLPSLAGKGAEARRMLFAWAFAGVLESSSFVIALKLSSASLISALTDLLSVAVVLGGYFFLKERKHLIPKLIAVCIGIAGLLLAAG